MSATPAIATMLTDELRAALTRAQKQVNSLLLGKQQEVRLAFVALLAVFTALGFAGITSELYVFHFLLDLAGA